MSRRVPLKKTARSGRAVVIRFEARSRQSAEAPVLVSSLCCLAAAALTAS